MQNPDYCFVLCLPLRSRSDTLNIAKITMASAIESKYERDDLSAQSMLNQQKVVHGFRNLRQSVMNMVDGGPKVDLGVVAEVSRTWRRYFLILNLEFSTPKMQINHIRMSKSDMGFMSLCRAWASAPGEIYPASHMLFAEERPEKGKINYPDDICLQWVQATHAELVNLSCQHTELCKNQWPSLQKFTALKRRVARVIVRWFDKDHAAHMELIDLIETESAHYADIDAHVASGEVPKGNLKSARIAFQERKHPARLVKMLAHEAAMRNPEDPVSENSIEAEGALWRDTPTELVSNYVRIAARVFYKAESDFALLDKYYNRDRKDAPPMRQQLFNRVREWVTHKCKTEQTESIKRRFRDTANLSWCPLGTDTHRWRSKITRSDATAPLTMLEGELGIDIAQHMHHRSVQPWPNICATSDDDDTGLAIMWDALFETLICAHILHTTTVQFRELYLITDPHTQESIQRIEDMSMTDKKRPLIVYIARNWYVLTLSPLEPEVPQEECREGEEGDDEMMLSADEASILKALRSQGTSSSARPRRQELLECNGIVHAFLAWLYIIYSEFDCREIHMRSMTNLANEFGIDDGAVQIE